MQEPVGKPPHGAYGATEDVQDTRAERSFHARKLPGAVGPGYPAAFTRAGRLRVTRGRIVVTDGGERASLACVRSLGAAGWTVHVVADRRGSLAAASRHAAAEHVAPSALAEPARFREEVARVASSVRADVLLPIGEASLLALGDDRSAFGPAVVPFPGLAAIRDAADKARVAVVARELGLAVPETVVLDRADALEDRVPGSLTYPVVLKPARSVRPDAAPGAKFAVSYAGDPAALRAAVASLPEAAFPVLLQRRIEGPGAGVFLLVDGDDVLAAFAHRRIRERPPSGGVSVYRESAALPDDLRDAAVALLRALGWRGVAMVEFKVDAATGRPYVMEVNPRLWGSLQLAIDAGVDFPVLLADWALGRRREAPDYRVGVRSRWMWGEVDHFLARVRARTAEGWRPALAEAKACLAEQLRDRGPRTRLEVLRRDDPRPFLRESVRWFRDVLR